jgi:Tfp pilus assembly protein PilN
MPAKELKINLLGGDDLSHTPWGRLIMWATTYGRYIMITTEIVVLLAFISRFSLDRKLTDLTEEISQKQAIIEANALFEQDVRALQAKMTHIKTLMGTQGVPLEVLTLVQQYIPRDVYLASYDFAAGKLTVSAVAATSGGLAQFLGRLQTSSALSDITVGDIRRGATSGIEFQFTAMVPNANPKK